MTDKRTPGGIGPEDARRMKDRRAELTVCAGLLRHGRLIHGRVALTRIARGDFYYAEVMDLFDACVYVAGGCGEDGLPGVYAEMRRRFGTGFDAHGMTRRLLLEAWDCWYWPDDVRSWWHGELDELPHAAGMALAMCDKVRWLAARRHGVHLALEQARAAIDGVVFPDD